MRSPQPDLEGLSYRGLEFSRGGLRFSTGSDPRRTPFHPCINCGTLLPNTRASSICSACTCPMHFGIPSRVCGCPST